MTKNISIIMRCYSRFFILLILLMTCNIKIFSQTNYFNSVDAIPTDRNFTYPQSIFVDSQSGHLWITDFSNHRVMRFDISTLSSINEKFNSQYPTEFFLDQNYPNPFNPVTQIKFSVKHSVDVELTVIDLLGQKVTTLFNGLANANTIYLINFDAKLLPAGIYLYRLNTIYGNEVKKMCLLK